MTPILGATVASLFACLALYFIPALWFVVALIVFWSSLWAAMSGLEGK